MTNRKSLTPVLQALLAALLFGASAPFAKILLGDMQPVTLAGFLYLGAGISLFFSRVVQKLGKNNPQAEAPLRREDVKWLAGTTLAGGMAAPIVLLFSLRATPASTAALLLNFEGVATTLIAALAFKEGISRRAWLAIGSITLAGILLSIRLDQGWGISSGALGILAACLLWGADNNLTCNISAKDSLAIVTVKGLAAGSFSLILAALLGNPVPSLPAVAKALLLGSLSYGLSLLFFVRALRGLGAARTSAWFGTAPLAGLLLSLVILREGFSLMLLAAVPLTLFGALLLVREKHGHRHMHSSVVHEHAHVHNDGHHAHEHGGGGRLLRPHSHLHVHAYLEHDHQHLPDLHHRHLHLSDD